MNVSQDNDISSNHSNDQSDPDFDFNVESDPEDDHKKYSKRGNNWTLIQEYNSKGPVELYFNVNKYRTRISHKIVGTCTQCEQNKEHNMTVRYRVCSSKECNEVSTCPAKYKIVYCETSSMYKIYSIESHIVEGASKKNEFKFGIFSPLKSLIAEKVINEDITAGRLEAMLIKEKKSIEENNADLKDFSIPSKTQLRNYVTLVKRKNGNNNKIDDVVQFVKNSQYHPDIDENELFFFGFEHDNPLIQSGADNKHLNLCFTTRKLFNIVDSNLSDLPSIFHIDATLCK